MVFVVIQRRHKVPTLYFLAPIVNFSLIITKKNKKKHANNKNHKKTFSYQTLIQDQVILYFLVYFLNQTLIDLISFQVIFFNIKKHKPTYLPLGFSFLNHF